MFGCKHTSFPENQDVCPGLARTTLSSPGSTVPLKKFGRIQGDLLCSTKASLLGDPHCRWIVAPQISKSQHWHLFHIFAFPKQKPYLSKNMVDYEVSRIPL